MAVDDGRHRPDHRGGNRRAVPNRRPPPWPFSTRAPRFPSSRATARRRPAGSTIRSCRTLDERLGYLRELEARRAAILKSIGEQGKLSRASTASIAAATTKAELEDIYLPYRPKRRTKAEIAREKGLGPLAEAILADRACDPETLAANFVTEAVPDAKAALEGARDILVEGFAENADLVGRLRDDHAGRAVLPRAVVAGKEAAGEKFRDYFDHTRTLGAAPSHRVLAMLRGRNEEVLSLDLEMDAGRSAR